MGKLLLKDDFKLKDNSQADYYKRLKITLVLRHKNEKVLSSNIPVGISLAFASYPFIAMYRYVQLSIPDIINLELCT